MELYQTDSHYILVEEDCSLWCSRTSGSLEAKQGCNLASAWNPVCLGQIYGIIGKVKLHPDAEWRLLLIRQRSLACQVASKSIYKINKIAVLPLIAANITSELELEPCPKHHSSTQSDKSSQPGDLAQISLQRTWNSLKTAGNSLKTAGNTLKTAAENVKLKKKETKDKEKFEKRVLEELLKMYNDSDFFYYSEDFDLTNSLQRQYSPSYDKELPLWKRADERFFWNKHMLLELMQTQDPLCDRWLLPVVQGYVQMETCLMDFDEDRTSPSEMLSVDYSGQKLEPLGYKISIISRRSRHRAGTRSRARGINSQGACANYVETEQIIEFAPHLVSFVQVRGSVPVFWSQSGFKYRPPPRLDKDEEESHQAFVAHFQEQLALYDKVAVVTLVEQAGKEHIIGDAYLSHVLRFSSPDITYITFDFHEYCRGMRFENVSILTEGIRDVIKDMRYCWVDNRGVICEQQGVFRVNCVDCLDRTNVVQTAIARIVMDTQFRKLGLLPPEENLPGSCRRTYQQIWANNGDVISRQYAGTAALKGDFTRTGERKFSGMMKDGVNSANRYYLRFRDAYRQAAIDLTLGQPLSEALMVPSGEVDDVDGAEGADKEENLKLIIEDCKRMLIEDPEYCQGGWALINADPVEGDSDQQDIDIILLLSQRSVYVAWYDDEQELVTKFQKIYLEDIDKIEIGLEPAVFKSKFTCLRLTYHHQATEGLFHMFRAPSTRFFNTKATAILSQDEAKESLRIIAEAFKSAQEILSLQLEIVDKPKLDKKKSGPHPGIVDVHQQLQENSLAAIKLPRNISAYIDPADQGPEKSNLDIASHTRPASPRSKSPLEFLNVFPSFPRTSLPSISRQVNELKFSLPKTKLKENLQNFNLIKKIKLPKDSALQKPNEAVPDKEELNLMSNQTVTLLLSEETSNDVVLDSCGILATSPSQIILSSMHLKAENKRKSSLVEALSSSPTVRAIIDKSGQEESIFTFHEHLFSDQKSGSRMLASQDALLDNDDTRVPHGGVGVAEKSTSRASVPALPNNSSRATFEISSEHESCPNDEEDTIIENQEVQAILGKCHHLYHPLMKTSISDTSLSLSAMQDTMGQPNASQKDSSIVSLFRSKMPGFSKTPTGRSAEPPLSKNLIRKSQRAMEVFEKLKHEKLPNEECKTIFKFI